MALKEADLVPHASRTRLKDGGQVGPSLCLPVCISLSGSIGKKISVRSCEFLPQAG